MHVNDLPPELLQKVFKCLPFHDKVVASMVCRRWFDLAFKNVTELVCDYVHMFPSSSYYEDYIERPSMYHNLDYLKDFYNKAFHKCDNWWDLFVLFPKVKKLQILVPELQVGILDSVLNHLPNIEDLFLCLEPTEEEYDWKKFGSKLTKLVSLKVEFLSHQADLLELQMIETLPNMKTLDLGYTAITDGWKKLIPARVTEARFKMCTSEMTNKSQSLFGFIFENATTLQKLYWEDAGDLKASDLPPLVGLKRLELEVNEDVEAVVFENCKALEYAYFKSFKVKNLTSHRQKLPNLKELRIQTLYGSAEDLKRHCPALVKLDVSRNAESESQSA